MARHIDNKKRRQLRRAKMVAGLLAAIDPRLHEEEFIRSLRNTREMRQLRGGSVAGIYGRGNFEFKLDNDPNHYRFEGVRTPRFWALSDVPNAWPHIDQLRRELESLGLKRGSRHARRRIEALEKRIQ